MQDLNEALGCLDKMVGGDSCEFNKVISCTVCPAGSPEGIICKLRIVQRDIRRHLQEEHPDNEDSKKVIPDKEQAPIVVGS